MWRGNCTLPDAGHEGVVTCMTSPAPVAQHSKRLETLKKKIEDAREAKDDCGVVLQKVIGVICQPDSVWLNADLPLRQTIQRLVFPKPLIYDQNEEKFRNVEKALVYGLFEEKQLEKALLAHPKRVELLTF